ncbi:MAG: HK97 family phage prohead protease [Mesorhizobium sp.]|nr:MAG: HK97 family phage prohead protease [Mesorhizobium sp.]TIO61802.1 MAG: HK97 family phage prohead protease [Mesorhizobium sp.]TJV66743.1 MAG: HK97 family phage prohead protease [Mesorhizobium sp.]
MSASVRWRPSLPSIEVRSADVAFSGTTAQGYAAVFNQWTRISNLFDERLDPACFDRTLIEDPDILALWNHSSDALLGRTTAGTLRLATDSHGLKFELDLDPRSPNGALCLSALERGDVHACSFGFAVLAQAWQDEDNWERPRRTITDVVLYEITITPTPAYPTTTASLRSAAANDNAANARRRTIERIEREHKLRGIQ